MAQGGPREQKSSKPACQRRKSEWVLPERSDDLYGRITAGADFELGETIALQVNGTASIERESGNEVAGFLAPRLSL